MNQKEVQQSLKRIISRAQSGTERAKSGCGSTGRRVTEPQSSSALIGLLWQVLVLGGDQRDQQQNLQWRGKARGGKQVAGAASFDHYHTGHGFWDSSMLGLDGTESMGAHMWEGMGTATWSGLGPP
ncbi:hypothetical protein WJX75_001715 [Coccomyxa subellipsoidea]|uniref:Uncharacterized protein n=1 Tax=Coccomyxa subellipsoidea TaxID=248742 RepID=A0ABR2Z2V9_9CHLO